MDRRVKPDDDGLFGPPLKVYTHSPSLPYPCCIAVLQTPDVRRRWTATAERQVRGGPKGRGVGGLWTESR